jgi:hypothetical protein
MQSGEEARMDVDGGSPSRYDSLKDETSRSFQFVPVHQNSRMRWLGRTDIVASNAAHHQWRQFKRIQPTGRKTRTTASSTTGRTGSETQCSGAFLIPDPAAQRRLPMRGGRSQGPSTHQNRVLPSLLTLSTRMLLCHAYPSPLPTGLVGRLFHNLYLHFTLACPSANGVHSIELCRFLLSHSGPFHAWIWMAQDMKEDVRPGHEPNRSKLQDVLLSIGLKHARRMLLDLNSKEDYHTVDEILPLYILVLALSCRDHKEASPFRGQRQDVWPRQAPLGKLGMLAAWGSGYRYRNIHADAAKKFLEMMGGMDDLPLFAAGIQSL